MSERNGSENVDAPDRPSKQAAIAALDKEFPSPDERAKYIYAILQKHAPDVTDWDVTCFAANYLGWQATTWEWLRVPAKHICSLVYTAHYLVTEKTGIGTGIPFEPRDSTPTHESKREPSRKRNGLDVSGGGFDNRD